MSSLSVLYNQRQKSKDLILEQRNFKFLDLNQAVARVRFLKSPEGIVCFARKKHYNINSNNGACICANWVFSEDDGLVQKKDRCPVCHLLVVLSKATDEDLFSRADSMNVRNNILPKFRYIWPNVLSIDQFETLKKGSNTEAIEATLGVIERGPQFFDKFALIAVEENDTFGDITSLRKGADIKLYNKVVSGWTTWSMQVLEKEKSLSEEAIAFVTKNLTSMARLEAFYKYPEYAEIFDKLDEKDQLLLREHYDIVLNNESEPIKIDEFSEEELSICQLCRLKKEVCEVDGYYEDAILSEGKACSSFVSSVSVEKESPTYTKIEPKKRFIKM